MSRKGNKKEEVEALERITSDALDELMGQKFAIYAKDIIQDRSIPDARDGLKPVQRRIIFDMAKTGNTIDKPTKKCAHIVGDVMGKYHPHGDSSIYDALAHMSQSWSFRYPLINFQGNNGSIDGDNPAAFRYTEARLSAISNELVSDIDKDTVDMELTFDDTEMEPTVLPARFPNLLVNGSEGIAVGISTSIPPHNLREISQAIAHRIKFPNCDLPSLMKYVPGPDFPTGGIIFDNDSLHSIYATGRGKVVIAGKCEIIEEEKAKKQIIITEIPFDVNKSSLVGQIDKVRHDKKIPGIEEVRDETDKSGLRIAIDLRDESKPQAILSYLLSKTDLKRSMPVHIVAIVDNRPKTMNLIDYCDCYIDHQLEVISRRSKFNLYKNQNRLVIVEGLIKAISILDEIVEIIKKSNDKTDSKLNIEKSFGFSEPQAEAIVTMPLYKLSHTDVLTLEKERDELKADISYLEGLLSDRSKREDVIIADLARIAKTYGDKRRTEIKEADEENLVIDKRDLIAKEEVMVVGTYDGYVKRSSLKSWKGSGGHNGAKAGIKAGDSFILECQCLTTDYLILFTKNGNYLYIAVNDIKETKWNDEGFHVNNLVSLEADDRLVGGFVVRDFRSDLYVVLLSKNNSIKRIRLNAFEVVRKSKPIKAIRLSKGDELVSYAYTSGNSNLFIVSQEGKAAYYNENEILLSNPKTSGIKAGAFKGKELSGLLSFAEDEKPGKVIFVTDRGHTRVFDMSKIELEKRLDKVSELYSMFKKEPHKLVYLEKVEGKELPYSLDAVLSDSSRVDVSFPDFYLTPMEKYAKRPDGFPAKNRIVRISIDNTVLIDDSIKSFEPPIRKEESSESIEESKNENASFEQISLFDDLEEEK